MSVFFVSLEIATNGSFGCKTTRFSRVTMPTCDVLETRQSQLQLRDYWSNYTSASRKTSTHTSEAVADRSPFPVNRADYENSDKSWGRDTTLRFTYSTTSDLIRTI